MPLTLAKETMDMNWKDAAASGSSQILLEGDMIVPDSKPDLQEILRCQGNVKIREKRVTDDRISFSGDLEISVLYRAKNGERPLYATLVIPTLRGMYGIHAHHSNMITAIIPGTLQYQIVPGAPLEAAVSNGLAKMENGEVLILVDSAERPEEIDANRARRDADAAKEAILQKKSIQEYRSAQANLARALSRLRVKRGSK